MAVVVEQTLHGYSDGHRLLAASVELDRSARSQLLLLSDMSGRSMVDGFQTYLTAYPLQGTGFYVFARTWYAAEMERPGCVWTHSLLVPEKDLGAIQDIGLLARSFAYPQGARELTKYGRSLRLDLRPEVFGGGIEEQLARRLLASIYGAPSSPILVAVDDSESLLAFVFSIWNQQWPRLRSNFSFCTGAISARTVHQKQFDLQLVPTATFREVKRDLPAAVSVDTTAQSEAAVEEEWIALAARDLAEPGQSDLRYFLRRFDAVFAERSAFRPLVQLSLCLRRANRPDIRFGELLDLLCEEYPSPEQGVEIKGMMLSPSLAAPQVLYAGLSDTESLQAIAIVRNWSALGGYEENVTFRAKRLWKEDRRQGERLVAFLTSHNHNSLGETMLSAMVASMAPNDLISYFGNRRSVLIAAVQRDPQLAAMPSIWSGSEDLQRELFDAAIAGREVSENELSSMVLSMLAAGSDCAVEQLGRRFGDKQVWTVLNWLSHEAHSSSGLLPGWRRYLGNGIKAAVAWVRDKRDVEPRAVAVLSQVFDPAEPAVQDLGADLWMTAIGSSSSLSQEELAGLASFSLALGLSLSSASACELVALTFEDVHSLAAADRLGYTEWKKFERQVPLLSPWRNWDKCERLRRGLIDSFERNQWPIMKFIDCAKSVDTLRELLHTCDDYRPSGRDLLRRMRDEKKSLRDELPAESWQLISRRLR